MMTSAPCLYLASASPRRRELLTQLGVAFALLRVDVEEVRRPDEPAETYVRRLAADKALAGWQACAGQLPVLGADTIVVLDGDVLEKPRDQQDAARMMRLLSGRTHQVMTAIAVVSASGISQRLVVTDVTFRALDEAEIAAYWQTGEPADKAGGYGIQGRAATWVARIEGSFSGIVGLPLFELGQLLRTGPAGRGGER